MAKKKDRINFGLIELEDLMVMSKVHAAGYKIIPTPVESTARPSNRMTLIRPNGKETNKSKIYLHSESGEMWEDILKEYHKIKDYLDGNNG